MASRLLRRLLSPPPVVLASASASSFQRCIHTAVEEYCLRESSLLQVKLEGILSVVGGEMIACDTHFSKDCFDYWKNAAIPSASTVKDLAAAWANMQASGPSFEFYTDTSKGKRMEEFLQKMVAVVEQRIAKQGFGSLEGRRLHVRFSEKQESFADKKNSNSKQNLNRSIDFQSINMPGSMDKKLEDLDDTQTCKTIHIFDSQGILEDKRQDETGNKADKGRVFQFIKSSHEQSKLHEIVPEDNKSEAASVQSKNKQHLMDLHKHGIEIKKGESKNPEGKDTQLIADGQKALDEEQKLELTHCLNVSEIGKQPEKKTEQKVMNKGSTAYLQQESVNARVEGAEVECVEDRKEEKKETLFLADEQQSTKKDERSEAIQILRKRDEKRRSEEKLRKQSLESHQQTNNIVWKPQRMGRKIVHTYYVKGSTGRASL